MKTRTATFTQGDQADFVVRVTVAPTNVGFSFEHGNFAPVAYNITGASMLQIAEGLQYVSDVVSEEVPGRLSPFVRGWNNYAQDAHENAVNKGFWPPEGRNDGEMIALMHAELSEALEALRSGNPPDDKLPEFGSVDVELADVIIRMMDFAQARGYRVAEAVERKMTFNKTRAFKHGKAF